MFLDRSFIEIVSSISPGGKEKDPASDFGSMNMCEICPLEIVQSRCDFILYAKAFN